MEREKFQRIRAYYDQYRQSHKALYERCRQNHLWYRVEQEEFGRKKGKEDGMKGAPESRTGHIFNAIQYKHADFMDNYPHINILPREEGDEEEAKRLSGIMPFILENCGFKKTYSDNCYEKLICGTAVYGVFFDPSLGDGRGDISIELIDLTRLSFQPDISDINDSKYVFYDSFMDMDEFRVMYGADKKNIKTQSAYDDAKPRENTLLTGEMAVVTDCYYKVPKQDGTKILHFLKFSGDEILDYTEGKEEYKNGLYDRGRYPFVFDVLHRVSDDVCGMGIVDIAKGPQAYIDKLDEIINKNALINGKPRYFISRGAGINKEAFLDLNQTLVEIEGSVNDDVIKQIKATSLASYIAEHRQEKIQELKEIVGNRDFNQGGTSGGVTAASAITALQNSGDKLSRDMINSSYYAFSNLIWLVIELVREFYTDERTFRVLGEDARFSYERYSNENIRPRPDADSYAALEAWALSGEGEMPAVHYEKPVFDISLTVEKNNPYQRGQHNELILALFNMGLFVPQNLDLGLFVISNLNFDGRDKLLSQLEELKQKQQEEAAMQQVQSVPQQMQGMQQETGGGEMLSVPINEPAGGSEMFSVPIGGEGML